jgi:hypothetical protein
VFENPIQSHGGKLAIRCRKQFFLCGHTENQMGFHPSHRVKDFLQLAGVVFILVRSAGGIRIKTTPAN